MASASPPPFTPSEPPPSPPDPTPPPSSAPPTPPSDPPPAPYPPAYSRPPPSDPPPPPSSPSKPRQTPPPLPFPPSSPTSSASSITVVLAAAIGGLAALLLASILIIFLLRKKRRPAPPPPPTIPASSATPTQPATQPPRNAMTSTTSPPADHPVELPSKPLPPPAHGVVVGFSKSIFTYQELVMATDGFSDGNLLGKGGFGYVHKGILNGKEVAIKQLKAGSREGEREFQAELEAIGHVHHKHLVSLLGYCNSGSRRLLVYEFIPNKTLEFHLHGKDQPTMEWPVRLKIALSAAKALAYLHEDCHPKIIHRDIKAANILLDYNLEAKVADFGLAKICSGNSSEVHTRVMGTLGYLAPEYATSHKLTTKSDVFSFGVLLLELITGRRPEELITGCRSVDSSQSFMDDSLVDWARPLLTRALGDGKCDALVDPQLKTYNTDQMARMIACAAACVRHSARHRPQMSKVVQALEGLISPEDLYEGVRPGQSQCIRSSRRSDYHSGHYNKLMRDVSKMASRRD